MNSDRKQLALEQTLLGILLNKMVGNEVGISDERFSGSAEEADVIVRCSSRNSAS